MIAPIEDLTRALARLPGLGRRSASRAALSLLRGDKNAVAESCDVPLTREEAAAMLRVSRQTVTAWAKRGVIRRMAIKGRRKALGYSRRSVMAILNGETVEGR